MSYFDPPPPENPRTKKRRLQERKLKLIRYGVPIGLFLLVVVADLLQAVFVYHDMGCMIARCVIAKSP